MRVLLTNDDGIDAIGLNKLYYAISSLSCVSDIWVVAPEGNKSCCSHSMSFDRKITATKYTDKKFGISGTPVDCVIVAIGDLMRKCKPDIVVSGINNGANLDVDVMYSGTVAAAREASLGGIPSIAVSQMYPCAPDRSEMYWKSEDKIFIHLLNTLISRYQDRKLFKPRSLINVNLPIAEITGVKFIPQGDHYLGNHIESISKEECYDKSAAYVIGTKSVEIKSQSLKEGFIVVTPLGVDCTDYDLLDYIKAQNLNSF